MPTSSEKKKNGDFSEPLFREKRLGDYIRGTSSVIVLKSREAICSCDTEVLRVGKVPNFRTGLERGPRSVHSLWKAVYAESFLDSHTVKMLVLNCALVHKCSHSSLVGHASSKSSD